jgi:hypothetical protein
MQWEKILKEVKMTKELIPPKYWQFTEAEYLSPGRWKTNYGYVIVYAPSSPEGKYRGWGFEHRVLMAEKIGRAISKEEVVHHKNGVRDDNRIENLEIMLKDEHDKYHRDKKNDRVPF